ncbi:hypothetical protein ACRE_084290 [Hapsidospora chrysogenum ATCC 11550]|uniref:Uncharacterized protein n=1 Tax=Hapsidospora chrysogenum (strain ATCC 11550 / CBS 779.69 / DSM 880 / IAM 14645 / JCM 23072 / IMI 49137) TaxID=857340 RepID=A0A086SUT2_HAPC1|nr:hypothetical protein ACRE_084290 [Hapsidospora chrysogenum ATCC 11550]
MEFNTAVVHGGDEIPLHFPRIGGASSSIQLAAGSIIVIIIIIIIITRLIKKSLTRTPRALVSSRAPAPRGGMARLCAASSRVQAVKAPYSS